MSITKTTMLTCAGYTKRAFLDCETTATPNEVIKLCVLADRLVTAELRNAAADAILRILELLSDDSHMKEVFPASMVALIWPATTTGKPHDAL